MEEIIVREDGLITTGNAAKLCGVSPITIRQWVRRGRLTKAGQDGPQILLSLLEVARADRTMRAKTSRPPAPALPWRLEGEPDVDIRSVFLACDALAQHACADQVPVPVIYYARFGDRIKIGTTTSLRGRMDDVPHDELLATEPGDAATETRRHAQFAQYRITREWFSAGPELVRHIEKLRSSSFACATPDV